MKGSTANVISASFQFMQSITPRMPNEHEKVFEDARPRRR